VPDKIQQQINTAVKDPVCGMTVDPHRAAAQSVHHGKSFYFCSQGCAARFAASPQKFPDDAPPAELHPSKRGSLEQGLPLKQIPTANYVCPMDPEVRQDHPGACPKCGMALEPVVPTQSATRVEYTCPMHPEIVRSAPGSCPICGMALERRDAIAEQHENPELADMTRRFWISVALTIPILALAVSDMIPGQHLQNILSPRAVGWIELILATPVVLWAGWFFFERAQHVHANRARHRHRLCFQRDRRPVPTNLS
jgi:Cu+-exporting ATPase